MLSIELGYKQEFFVKNQHFHILLKEKKKEVSNKSIKCFLARSVPLILITMNSYCRKSCGYQNNDNRVNVFNLHLKESLGSLSR